MVIYGLFVCARAGRLAFDTLKQLWRQVLLTQIDSLICLLGETHLLNLRVQFQFESRQQQSRHFCITNIVCRFPIMSTIPSVLPYYKYIHIAAQCPSTFQIHTHYVR